MATMEELSERPFTAMVQALRDNGLRYQDLVNRSDEARSAAWFNNLINHADPWWVGPPTREAWPGLAKLLNVSEAQVREAVAVEWYGVGDTHLSTAARTLAEDIDTLGSDDVAIIAALAKRLSSGATS